ncbi:hypothetical protein C7S18_19930 [Ahniella affigens]|uniref:Uncharacterized protein n=1 Tax=Ahniella affigens TaxID=2021234 RepID=A0A2P1PWT1_9GAMM|nr:hypothetical protein [Ahniella affigens]AVP99297.1 hypothetical protein C7S18_19930 [Ahniella affigens]
MSTNTSRSEAVKATTHAALDDAYREYPERLVNGAPKAKAAPDIVYINPLAASVVTVPPVPQQIEVEVTTRQSIQACIDQEAKIH